VLLLIGSDGFSLSSLLSLVPPDRSSTASERRNISWFANVLTTA
jgi:hypothetical protein